MLDDLYTGIRTLIYPKNCILCHHYFPSYNDEKHICISCTDMLKFNKPPFCLKCSRFFEDNSDHELCPTCRKFSHHFNHSWSAVIYNDTIKRLIHLFKYQNKTLLRKDFSNIIINFIEDYRIAMNYDLAVAIPLHSARRRERGYNQSQLLLDLIARKYRLKISKGNLIRIRNTPNQALLKQKDRWTNIKGAFKIRNPSFFRGKSVLILDDLYTTGATSSEAANTLKLAGAVQVDVVTLAIADTEHTGNNIDR